MVIQLYRHTGGLFHYEPSDLTLVPHSVVDLMMSDEMVLLERVVDNPAQRRKETESVGINYGSDYPMRPKSLVFDGVRYNIDATKRICTLSKEDDSSWAFWDADKVPFNQYFIVKANLNEILDEFRRENFRVID